jgi:small subunit ribosomal protein S9
MPTKTKKKPNYIYARGRRKTATARVRLYSKKGPILVNGQPIKEYFPDKISKITYLKPFDCTNTVGKFSATIKVEGSGKNGQLGALTHGLARALAQVNEKQYRPALKKEGLLTRDPRMRERRKVGTGGRARRQKQSPKR